MKSGFTVKWSKYCGARRWKRVSKNFNNLLQAAAHFRFLYHLNVPCVVVDQNSMQVFPLP